MTNRPQLGYIHLQGLAPSKDSFWSTSAQPGSPYDGTEFAEEPFPELQAAVTSLSAGPVAPSDGVDYADAALILRCCRADGRLLQPSKPARLIDRAFRYRAFASAASASAPAFATTASVAAVGKKGAKVGAKELRKIEEEKEDEEDEEEEEEEEEDDES